jgi:hypothetical protein
MDSPQFHSQGWRAKRFVYDYKLQRGMKANPKERFGTGCSQTFAPVLNVLYYALFSSKSPIIVTCSPGRCYTHRYIVCFHIHQDRYEHARIYRRCDRNQRTQQPKESKANDPFSTTFSAFAAPTLKGNEHSHTCG